MMSKQSLKKSEKAKVAQSMLEGGEVHERLKDVFKRQPGGLNRVEVEYHNLSVETDGKVRRVLGSLRIVYIVVTNCVDRILCVSSLTTGLFDVDGVVGE